MTSKKLQQPDNCAIAARSDATSAPISISNADFLGTIFAGLSGDEYLWTTVFTGSPKKAPDSVWTGKRTYPETVRETPHGNAYFSVAVLKQEVEDKRKRNRDCFSKMPVVVIDDPQSCDFAPTWKLETSKDNYQIGFLLDTPITEYDVATRLLQELVNQKLIRVDTSGNNPIRYVRLPVGQNHKTDPYFQCRLIVWQPERIVSLQDLCQSLGIDYEIVVNEPAAKEPVKKPKEKADAALSQRTIDDLRSAITHLTEAHVDAYDDWIKLGLALSSLKGSQFEQDAHEMFHQLSGKSDKYDEAECTAKWNRALNANKLTYKTIFYVAQQAGWINPRKASGGVFNPLWGLAQRLDMEESDLAEQIAYAPAVVGAIVTSTAYEQNKGKYFCLHHTGDLRIFNDAKWRVGMRATFGPTHDSELLLAMLTEKVNDMGLTAAQQEKFIGSCAGLIDTTITNYIFTQRQFGTMKVSVDMFTDTASMQLYDGLATLNLPHLPFEENVIDDAVVADYKDHWPLIDEFLDLVVAARFAKSRKKAFLWIKTMSDWGKSFLLSLMNGIGLSIEMSALEVEKAFSGQPIGRTLRDFRRCWIFAIEEFKSVKSELKQLEQSIQFSPKNMPTCEVPLYLKLFLSAESVESLASLESGIEDQFANRFAQLEPASVKLTERALYNKSYTHYGAALQAYVATYLNRRVEEYRALGAMGAADRGDREVVAFHQKYGIDKKYERLSAKLPALAQEFKEWVLDQFLSGNQCVSGIGNKRPLSSTEREVLAQAKIHEVGLTRELYITGPDHLITLWLNATFNQSARGKLVWKAGDLRLHLPKSSVVRLSCSKKALRAMFVEQLDSHPDPYADEDW